MLQKFIQSALLLVVLFTTVQSYAQVSQAPDGIQFQALATDANGHPAAGRVIYVKNAIIAKTATGAVVYAETFKVTASSAGIFSIVIGKGTYTSGVSSIANIDWSNGPFFLNLKIAIEPTIPTASWNVNNEYVDMGTSQFWSVPYALYAGNVKGADGKLNTSDTAAMLKPYFTAINLKVNTADVNISLALKANATDVTSSLATKVDKISGKELSTNDYTTAEKSKLAAITGTNTGDQDLSALAVVSEVNAALALKANAIDVNTNLVAKENTSNKSINVTTDGASDTKYPSVKSVKTYVDTQVAGATIADATSIVKGKILLAGDLGGTATAPTVPGLALKLDANQKGVPNGVASLNAQGIIPSSQLPPVTLSSTSVVGSDAAMTALSSATVGSIAVRTDVNKNYVLSALPASTLGNWIELLTPAAPVQAVNGYTGNVNLTKTDLGLGDVNNTSDINKPVSTATQAALDTKANLSDVNTSLATKISTIDVNAALALKANISDVNTALDTKISTTDANAALALKANSTDVNTALATKISNADATAALALKLNANKVGALSGVASLDASGKVPTDQIPAISFSSVKVLKSEAEMLALSTAVVGSVVIRTDESKNYVLAQANPAVLANWIQLLTPAAPVQTVNGRTGTVSISATDLGLGNVQNTSDANKPVSSATQTELDKKVDKVTGKDLSTNDYTDTEKTKLAAITGTNTGDQDLSGYATTTFVRSAVEAPRNNFYIGVNENLGLGSFTALPSQTGVRNTLIGNFTLQSKNAGDNTTALGHAAGNYFGSGTGLVTSVNKGLYLGAFARSNANNQTNEIVIGADALGNGSNTIQLGNTTITNTKTSGTLTAGAVTYPNVHGIANQVLTTTGSGTLTWTTVSGAANAGSLSGTVGVANGGTGATTAAAARTNLGLVIGTDVQASLIAGTDFLAPTGSAAGLTNFPTFNQNTTGNAATATKLAASKTINGVAFDGSSDITIAATASTISGTVGIANGGTGAATAAAARTNLGLVIGTDVQAPLTAGTDYLAPTGSAAGLTNFPTFNQNTTGNAATATLATNATTATNVSGIVAGVNGGTGIANNGKTITLAGNFQTTGGHALTLTTSATTNVTLPTSGTLATVQQVDAKATLASPAFTGTPTAPTAATADNSTKIATTEFVKAAISAGNAGIRTIGAISSTSNAKAAVISGTELVLTPADASNAGIITTGSQTFAGAKTFANDLVTNGTLTAGTVTYPNAHGTANQVLSTTGSGTLTWTTPSLASLTGYTNGLSPYNVGLGLNTSASANGQFNTAVGIYAMQYNISSENTAIGFEAMRYISQANSNNNVVIGSQAAKYFGASGQWNNNYKTMNKSVYIGSFSRASNYDTNNEIVIGYDAVGNGSNTVRLGNTSITAVHTQGSFYANSVQLTSDYRLKKNIKPLENGISTVLKLNPVNYEKKNSLESSNYDKKENGFIAQEIQKVLPYIVDEGKDKDRLLSVDYTSIIPVLTKAIQEQQVIIEQLKSSNEANTIQLKKLLELVENLQKEKK